jgi:hypothetical protein
MMEARTIKIAAALIRDHVLPLAATTRVAENVS